MPNYGILLQLSCFILCRGRDYQMVFRNYINPEEDREANRLLPKLMVEGLLLGGTGLGVLALIFEIAADAFSVAAYQTLLAIHGDLVFLSPKDTSILYSGSV